MSLWEQIAPVYDAKAAAARQAVEREFHRAAASLAAETSKHTEAASESKAPTQPQASATKTPPKPKAAAKPKPQAVAKPKPKPKAAEKPEAKPKAKPKAVAKPKPKAVAKPKPKAAAKPEAKPKATPKPKAAAKKPNPKAGPDSTARTASEPEVETKPKPKASPEPKARAASEPGVQTRPETKPSAVRAPDLPPGTVYLVRDWSDKVAVLCGNKARDLTPAALKKAQAEGQHVRDGVRLPHPCWAVDTKAKGGDPSALAKFASEALRLHVVHISRAVFEAHLAQIYNGTFRAAEPPPPAAANEEEDDDEKTDEMSPAEVRELEKKVKEANGEKEVENAHQRSKVLSAVWPTLMDSGPLQAGQPRKFGAPGPPDQMGPGLWEKRLNRHGGRGAPVCRPAGPVHQLQGRHLQAV